MAKSFKYLVIIVLAFFVANCGNTEDKITTGLHQIYNPDKINCMGDNCTSHNDCLCTGADTCIDKMAEMDPNIKGKGGVCTIHNCHPGYESSCPPGWDCYEVPMGNSLLQDAETICIPEEPLDDVENTDMLFLSGS